MLYTRRQEPIDVRRSSVRRSRGRRGGYVPKMRTRSLAKVCGCARIRLYECAASTTQRAIDLRCCGSDPARLLFQDSFACPTEFSTNGNNSRPPSSEHVRLSNNPALPPLSAHAAQSVWYTMGSKPVSTPAADGSWWSSSLRVHDRRFRERIVLSAKPQLSSQSPYDPLSILGGYHEQPHSEARAWNYRGPPTARLRSITIRRPG